MESKTTGAATRGSPRSRFSVALLAALITLLVAILCAEGLLRATHFAGPFGMVYVADSVIGHRLRPGFQVWFRGEGESFFTVNSDGMPDAERVIAKPANTFRIAVVGDSFTEAAGVPRSQRFSEVMQAALAACPALHGQNVEVLSFGVSAYGPAHELIAMRTQVRRYSPNVILLALFLGNDLRANVRELNGPEPMPFFVSVGDSLELDSASRHLPGPHRTGWLYSLESLAYRRSRTLQAVQAVRVKLRSPIAPQGVVPVRPPGVPDTVFGFEAGANWEIFLPPRSDAWQRGWQVLDGLLGMMKAENESAGIAFRVVAVPSAIQAYPDSVRRASFLASIGASSFSFPAARLNEIAGRRAIPLLDLAAPLLAYAEQHRAPVYGSANAFMGLGHWNVSAHRAAGEAIAHWLCEGLNTAR